MANTFKFGNGKWAVKDGYALAYNDENGNFKPLPFDFTRSTSATRVNKQGLIETVGSNEPRIDFTDANGALLLEPSRTNLYTYSNDVSFWTKSNVVTTSNYAISPDGTQNAFRAAFSSSTGLLYVTATGTTGTNNTLSVWAKSNNGSSNKFRFFANGTTTLSNDFIATDEWQRFEFTYNCTSVTSGLTGASDSATNDIIFYGFQHEVGSYATSIINTSGSAVTRVADTAQIEDFKNTSTEGVVFYDFTANNIESANGQYLLQLFAGSSVISTAYSSSNSISIIANGGLIQIFNNAFSQTLYSVNPPQNSRQKFAIRYDGTNIVAFVNGVKQTVYADTSTGVKNAFRLNNGENSSYKNNGLIYYNTALTDAELIALTTI